ncbi:hypothetical protein ABZT03_36520 [Streptomyces sp. NPDC005574]|uniref:hypothetical protein n=1 Tax=Streptomyces sp. NPDC005574 TaxID=3156891 RepID=UPI0033A3EF76
MAYSDTLGSVLEVMDLHGYPSQRMAGLGSWETSAVGWLDGGLWLHHTLHLSEEDGGLDVLTLIVPCTCGRGYTDITLASEEMLLILAELQPTHGRSVHDEGSGDCRSVRLAAPLGGSQVLGATAASAEGTTAPRCASISVTRHRPIQSAWPLEHTGTLSTNSKRRTPNAGKPRQTREQPPGHLATCHDAYTPTVHGRRPGRPGTHLPLA